MNFYYLITLNNFFTNLNYILFLEKKQITIIIIINKKKSFF